MKISCRKSAKCSNSNYSYITSNEENSTVNSFDSRYDKKFGEPTTEAFTVDEFNRWMKEIINFEES